MVEFLSKAIDLLKAGAWQLVALACAAAAFLFLDRQGYLPAGINDTWRLGAWALLLICAFLSLAPALSSLQRIAQQNMLAAHKRSEVEKARKAAEQSFRDYIPYMTGKERAILGYLLKRKQKTFTADMDAGYGAGLMARRFIVPIGIKNQTFDADKMPMAVPDHVWKVMEEDPSQFEYKPVLSEGRGARAEFQPWRIPWEAR